MTIEATTADGKAIKTPLPEWAGTGADDSVWKYLDLKSTVGGLLFKKEQVVSKHGPDFAATSDANGDGQLQLHEIPEQWVERPNVDDAKQDLTYSGTALREAFAKIDPNSTGVITRAQWCGASARLVEDLDLARLNGRRHVPALLARLSRPREGG